MSFQKKILQIQSKAINTFLIKVYWFQVNLCLYTNERIEENNPYQVVAHKNFESIDNQYNCLGIDDNEAKKYINHVRDPVLHWENNHSHEDCGNPQDQNNLLFDFGVNKYIDPFNSYNEIPIHHKLPYLKHKEEPSEDIIVVNDSDNEIIVPQEMEVQQLDKSEDDFTN